MFWKWYSSHGDGNSDSRVKFHGFWECAQIWLKSHPEWPIMPKKYCKSICFKYTFNLAFRISFPETFFFFFFTNTYRNWKYLFGYKVHVSTCSWLLCVSPLWVTHLFYRQLDFPFQPGVAHKMLENEPKSCFTIA